MKSTNKIVKTIILVISFLVIIFESLLIFLCKGNVVVDSLIFTGFEYVEPFSPNMSLNNNQYVFEDSLYTVFKDSVDYEIHIDSNLVFKDTLYYNTSDSDSRDTVPPEGWYSLYRNSCWISPGKHYITIKSTTLNVSYRHTFRCFALMIFYIDSSREPPYFTIRKSFIPLKRNMI